MKWFFTGMLMLIVEPLLRLPEALLRMHFLSEYYGTFWEALMSDWFFSEGWFAYIKTPLGFWFNVFVLVWTLVGLGLVGIAFFQWSREEKKLTHEIKAMVGQKKRSE